MIVKDKKLKYDIHLFHEFDKCALIIIQSKMISKQKMGKPLLLIKY